jgi:hypothetical protein
MAKIQVINIWLYQKNENYQYLNDNYLNNFKVDQASNISRNTSTTNITDTVTTNNVNSTDNDNIITTQNVTSYTLNSLPSNSSLSSNNNNNNDTLQNNEATVATNASSSSASSSSVNIVPVNPNLQLQLSQGLPPK